MYTKEELERLSIPELMEIANELDVKVSQDDELESVIYAILDKAAENSAAGIPATKRKRTRIAKKDTSKVYTVNGSDGENLDTKSQKKKSAKKPTLDSLLAEQEAAEQEAAAEAATEAESETEESATAESEGAQSDTNESQSEEKAESAEESA